MICVFFVLDIRDGISLCVEVNLPPPAALVLTLECLSTQQPIPQPISQYLSFKKMSKSFVDHMKINQYMVRDRR